MTINAGVWIDHHKAVVVRFTDTGEDTLQITPEAGAPAFLPDGTRAKKSYTRNDFVAEDKRQRKATMHLNQYYDEVIDRLRDADAILVLGPGEAKGEFTKRIEGSKLKGRIAHVGTVDKMTDHEIAAHVRRLLGIGPQHSRLKDASIT